MVDISMTWADHCNAFCRGKSKAQASKYYS